MAFGCTVVSTVARLRSLPRSANRKFSANSSSSLSPEPLASLAQVRALVREGVLENSSPLKSWKYGPRSQRSHIPSSDSR